MLGPGIFIHVTHFSEPSAVNTDYKNIRSETHTEKEMSLIGVHSFKILTLIEAPAEVWPSVAVRNRSRTVRAGTEELLFSRFILKKVEQQSAGSQRQTERQKQTAAGM